MRTSAGTTRTHHHTVTTTSTTTDTTPDFGGGWYKCPNYSVCHAAGTKWAFSQHAGLCPACYMCLGHLHFFTQRNDSVSSGDVCPICLEQGGERVQMTCGGNHDMCTACFRQPLTFVRYPTLFDFGCPRFKPGTPGQLDIIEAWRRLHPAKYIAFFKSLVAFGTDRDKRASAQKELLTRCPVCRGGSPWNGKNTGCALAGETI